MSNMDNKDIEELSKSFVQSFNKEDYDHAYVILYIIHTQLEETRLKLSLINMACVNTMFEALS